jgi:hypothetical protein
MPEDRNLAAMRTYYERGEEARLAVSAAGLLECERTKEIVLHPGPFTGYAHRPGQFRAEMIASGPHLLATAHA